MKPTITTLLGIILATVLCSAGPVPQKVTQDIARSFFAAQPETRATSPSVKLLWDGMYMGPSTKSYSETPPFYVYGIEGGEGFVVVSGDDLCRPILGYSYSGTFDPDDIPDGMRDWIEMTRGIINEGNARRLSASKSVAKEWKDATILASRMASNPIKKLKTALWTQNAPFNNKSPIVNGKHSSAGCTNTAAAIVMAYWEHPKAGKGTLPGYVSIRERESETITINLPGHDLGHSYDWDNMLMDYSGPYSDVEADAVATLMYDMGILNQSNWSPGSTSASHHTERYIEMMGYDKSMSYLYMSDCENIEVWYSMLRKEIDELRPVVYVGFQPSSGHSFVFDGYASGNYFSINWGWGGNSNGYFAIDPSGGVENLMEYTDKQAGIFGMKPEDGSGAPLHYRLSVEDFSTTLRDAILNKESTFNVSIQLSQDINQQLPVTNIVCLALLNNGEVVRFLSDAIECTVGNESQLFELELETPTNLIRGDYICLGLIDENGKWERYKDKSAAIGLGSNESLTEGVSYRLTPDGLLNVCNLSKYTYIEVIGRTVGPNRIQQIDMKSRAGTDLSVRIYDVFESYEAVIRL